MHTLLMLIEPLRSRLDTSTVAALGMLIGALGGWRIGRSRVGRLKCGQSVLSTAGIAALVLGILVLSSVY